MTPKAQKRKENSYLVSSCSLLPSLMNWMQTMLDKYPRKMTWAKFYLLKGTLINRVSIEFQTRPLTVYVQVTFLKHNGPLRVADPFFHLDPPTLGSDKVDTSTPNLEMSGVRVWCDWVQSGCTHGRHYFGYAGKRNLTPSPNLTPQRANHNWARMW